VGVFSEHSVEVVCNRFVAICGHITDMVLTRSVGVLVCLSTPSPSHRLCIYVVVLILCLKLVKSVDFI